MLNVYSYSYTPFTIRLYTVLYSDKHFSGGPCIYVYQWQCYQCLASDKAHTESLAEIPEIKHGTGC